MHVQVTERDARDDPPCESAQIRVRCENFEGVCDPGEANDTAKFLVLLVS